MRIIIFCNKDSDADELIKEHCNSRAEAVVITPESRADRIKGYKELPAYALRSLSNYEFILCHQLGIKPTMLIEEEDL